MRSYAIRKFHENPKNAWWLVPSPEAKSTLESGKKSTVKTPHRKPILLSFVNLLTVPLCILSEEKHFYFELNVDLLEFKYSSVLILDSFDNRLILDFNNRLICP